jgi:hypothetical protein
MNQTIRGCRSSFMPVYLIAGLGFFILSSCTKHDEKNQTALARVYDKYLYAEDLSDIIPKESSPKDSARIADNYINSWVREMLIIHKAEENLASDQKDMEKQLTGYRNSLITYAYERELISQKLDTIVEDEEIENYYNSNKSNFELKDNIIKVNYIKVNRKAPYLEKLRKWYKSELPKDRELLSSYCYQFAENFYLDNNAWLLFDDLLKEIPIETYNKELFLQNNRFVEVQDSTHFYFVNIKGFKVKNSISPLAFEKQNVKNIILNKRKLELISGMKNNIYKEALDKKDFEIYKASIKNTNDK